MAAKQGPDVLLRMPNGTKCILLVSAMRDALPGKQAWPASQSKCDLVSNGHRKKFICMIHVPGQWKHPHPREAACMLIPPGNALLSNPPMHSRRPFARRGARQTDCVLIHLASSSRIFRSCAASASL
jgi:hypothetical protein